MFARHEHLHLTTVLFVGTVVNYESVSVKLGSEDTTSYYKLLSDTFFTYKHMYVHVHVYCIYHSYMKKHWFEECLHRSHYEMPVSALIHGIWELVETSRKCWGANPVAYSCYLLGASILLYASGVWLRDASVGASPAGH